MRFSGTYSWTSATMSVRSRTSATFSSGITSQPQRESTKSRRHSARIKVCDRGARRSTACERDVRVPAVSRIGKEVAIVAVGITALTFAFTRLRGTFANDYVPLLVGGLFLFTAMRMAQREPNGLARYGISLGGLLET